MKIKKTIALSKKVKILLCLIIAAAAIFLAYEAFRIFKQPAVESQTYSVYDYCFTPDVTYQVEIKENPVYPGSFQEENLIYTRSLIKDIIIQFSQDFSGTEEVVINGDYRVTAQVRGTKNSEQGQTIIWAKDYEICPDKTFESKGDGWQNAEKVIITLDEYEEFAKQALEVTEITANAEVEVALTGQLNISGTQKPITIPLNSSVSIPVNSSTFEIQKNAGDPVSDSITETIEVPISKDMRPIVFLVILCILCIVGIILLLIAARDFTELEMVKKHQKKIINTYGSRMTAIRSVIMPTVTKGYQVATIEDLIKVSDDLQLPIVYRVNEKNECEDYSFYVISKQIMFVYEMMEREKKDEKESDITN